MRAARQLLGPHLSAFLLSGYQEEARETERVARRAFHARSRDSAGEHEWLLEITTSSPLGLPRGSDPAVLAALLFLHQFHGGRGPSVTFRPEEIAQMLSLREREEETKEAHQVMEWAIRRYFATKFRASRWQSDAVAADEELNDYSYETRLLIEYERHKRMRFADEVAGPLRGPNVYRRNFLPILEAAELTDKPYTPYSLRHTFATLSIAAGASPKAVSYALGHASVKFTLDVYCHIVDSMKLDASGKLGQLLFKSARSAGGGG